MLHDEGYKAKNSIYKLFSFSSFLENGKYDKERAIFSFGNNVSFVVSSPIAWFSNQIINNISKNDKYLIGPNLVIFDHISVCEVPVVDSNKIIIKTISPIETHITENKKTIYFEPDSIEFKRIINSNLKKKWMAFHNKECGFDIKISKLNECRKTVATFKGIYINSWNGSFILEGPKEFLRFAFDVGLGSRNSSGFGMIKLENGEG